MQVTLQVLNNVTHPQQRLFSSPLQSRCTPPFLTELHLPSPAGTFCPTTAETWGALSEWRDPTPRGGAQ